MTQESVGGVATPKKELLRGMLIAAGIAGLLLVTAILPAEYGIDPTGAGKALGLTKLYSPQPALVAASATVPAVAAAAVATPAAIATAPVAATGSTVSAKGEVRSLTIASAQKTPYRTNTMEVVLPPNRGVEVKTTLAKGATLIYSWKTKNGELVNHDFHGEPVDAGKDEFESFILEKGVNVSRGSLIAPFSGVHGWYWKNLSDEPVTIMLSASGFYTEILKK